MRYAQEGEIVVIMAPCHEHCPLCLRHIGATGLVAETYHGTDEVVLQIEQRELRKDPDLQGGFFARNLYVTGMTA